ncbi:hypothetical protein ACGFZB_06405 [Streptomyces cinerochromogenes]|uniref:Uncharacterized protein n=1 Tax=Streptomyces cinerochromogenes TaxID=66422 RepID=A0ABW7AZW9_9ACTN
MAETRSAPEQAAVVAVADQPVSVVIRGFRTGKDLAAGDAFPRTEPQLRAQARALIVAY